MSNLTQKALNSPVFINLVILVLLAVYVGSSVLPGIESALKFVLTILTPFFLGIFLYYLLRPLVQFLQRKMNINLAIAIAYLVLALFVTFVGFFIYPAIQKQFDLLFESGSLSRLDPLNFRELNLFHHQFIIPEEVRTVLSNYFNLLINLFVNNFSYFVSAITTVLLTMVVSLFILFYLLKDDKKIYDGFISLIPKKYVAYTEGLMSDFDDILLHFISGRFIISLIVSLFLLIGFLSIGISYPFVLTLVSFIFYIIPTIGCFIAMILPLIIGFTTSPLMGVEVLVICGIAAILEGFLITPQVLGKALYIHPLTIILVLLSGGLLYGILGLLFATPIYVMLKIFCIRTYELFRESPQKLS